MPMQPWFTDAKLGIFIHYGIYAVDGVGESWSMYWGSVPRDRYMRQMDGLTAEHYDPEALAALIERAGAQYAVLTTKHHDGVALWDTGQSDLSVVKASPAGRDLVAGYVDAIRARGLKAGLYFSLSDWSHPDYATLAHPLPPYEWLNANRMSACAAGTEDPQAWERYLDFQRAQLHELIDRFAPDLLWFDGEWERDIDQWRLKELRAEIIDALPEVVINGRMLGLGDYRTRRSDSPWAWCRTARGSCARP